MVEINENMSSDKNEYKTLVENNLKAAENFKRRNAAKFVETYIKS